MRKRRVSERRQGKERAEGRGRERNRKLRVDEMVLLSLIYNLHMFLFMLDYETYETLYNSIYSRQKIPQAAPTLKQSCTYVP